MGLTALFMWLSLRTSNPTITVEDIYFPGLNKTLNNPKNTTVYLSLKLDNGNKDKGIRYDTVNLNLSYVANNSDPHSRSFIDDSFIPAFYQGHKKKAIKPANFSTEGLNWTEVRRVLSTNKIVFFRVDLATAVRFKIMAWNTKRQKLMVGANVQVNDLGALVKIGKKKKGTKLSKATKNGLWSLQVGILVNLLIWVVLNF